MSEKNLIERIVLAEEWTFGKQVATVLLLGLAVTPLILAYVYKSELMTLVTDLLKGG